MEETQPMSNLMGQGSAHVKVLSRSTSNGGMSDRHSIELWLAVIS